MKTYSYLTDAINKKGAGYLILIDPDKIGGEKLAEFTAKCESAGVDGFLVGGSIMISGDLNSTITTLKEHSSLPVILFPGGIEQLSPYADALLYISLISGRNAEQIFGKQVLAAPIIRKFNLETISCGYMLIESGRTTTAEYISGSKPIPRNKPEIAAATAMAAEMFGMKSVYLEGGSGAELTVPSEMIKMVSESVDIPVIVGGGIRTPEEAHEKVLSGANIIVTGNHFEVEGNWNKIDDFAAAVHVKS